MGAGLKAGERQPALQQHGASKLKVIYTGGTRVIWNDRHDAMGQVKNPVPSKRGMRIHACGAPVLCNFLHTPEVADARPGKD